LGTRHAVDLADEGIDTPQQIGSQPLKAREFRIEFDDPAIAVAQGAVELVYGAPRRALPLDQPLHAPGKICDQIRLPTHLRPPVRRIKQVRGFVDQSGAPLIFAHCA
jgi:hypothetical protein